jgi:hypothetical protein
MVAAVGDDLRLIGLSPIRVLGWAPGSEAALLQAPSGLYALRPGKPELQHLADWQPDQFIGWAGANQALLIRWDRENHEAGQLSLATGTWRPLASLPGRRVQICQNGSDWLWVDVQTERSGGAGSRSIGPVYRTPADAIPFGVGARGTPAPLAGDRVLERGALLGRLADGSCLLDDMDQRLLLARPTGELQVLTDSFALPRVAGDGRGVIWREEAGPCPECIELGPGVPFGRLVWWRLDGAKLIADVGTPRVLTPLLSPDGERLVIGHRTMDGKSGAIGVLSAAGFVKGADRTPPLVPAGWMGAELLAHPAGPERWRERSPIYRAADGAQVAEALAEGSDDSLLIDKGGETWFLAGGGAGFQVRSLGGDLQLLGQYQPEGAYAAVRKGDSVWLLRLGESPR